MDSASVFGLSLLQAINDWQRGGERKVKRRRATALKKACAALPARFREVHLVCFRQIALEKKDVWDLLGEGALHEEISAWTTDIATAKTLKGGVPPQGQGFQGVIFTLMPDPARVVVNLGTLYRDRAFQQAVEHHKTQIAGFGGGIGRYGATQSEVVLQGSVVA